MADSGSAYEASGELARAEEAYLRALALDPDFADLRLRLGTLLLRRGGAAEAEAEATRALRVQPNRQALLQLQQASRESASRSLALIRFILFLLARLAVGSVCLLTAAYATLNCSTFAFDMFIRPQLFPWITSFVNWHHIWSFGAFALSVPTLATAFGWRAANHGRQRWAFLSAVAYAVVVGAFVARLVYSPLLPTLWGDWRSWPVAVAALVPLVWLAVIDHLVASPLDMRRRWSYRPRRGPGPTAPGVHDRGRVPLGRSSRAGRVFRPPVRGRGARLARDRRLDAGTHGGRIGSGLRGPGHQAGSSGPIEEAVVVAPSVGGHARRDGHQRIPPASRPADHLGPTAASRDGGGHGWHQPCRSGGKPCGSTTAAAPERSLHGAGGAARRSLTLGRASRCPAGPAMADVVPPAAAGSVGLGFRRSASPRHLRKRMRPRPRHASGP